jgi:hypothetical protein
MIDKIGGILAGCIIAWIMVLVARSTLEGTVSSLRKDSAYWNPSAGGAAASREETEREMTFVNPGSRNLSDWYSGGVHIVHPNETERFTVPITKRDGGRFLQYFDDHTGTYHPYAYSLDDGSTRQTDK